MQIQTSTHMSQLIPKGFDIMHLSNIYELRKTMAQTTNKSNRRCGIPIRSNSQICFAVFSHKAVREFFETQKSYGRCGWGRYSWTCCVGGLRVVWGEPLFMGGASSHESNRWSPPPLRPSLPYFPGHALHEKGLQRQMGVGTLVSSQEERALLVLVINR